MKHSSDALLLVKNLDEYTLKGTYTSIYINEKLRRLCLRKKTGIIGQYLYFMVNQFRLE